MERILGGVDRRAANFVRRARQRSGPATSVEEIQLRSTVGYQLYSHIHRPTKDSGPLPGVLLCPGIDDPGSIFDSWMAPVTADEIARLGCVVLHFDPAGRGKSWGEEDFGGPEHQDDVRCALRYLAGRPDVDASRLGVVAISLGVSMAVGALANSDLPVSWLMDWEGPCDREIITAGGTIMAPANGHSLDDEVYWQPREAVRHVASLSCGYLRIQGARDHAQPGETRHAMRMMREVARGDLPWFQINDHARGEVPDRPVWGNPGRLPTNHMILRKVQELMG